MSENRERVMRVVYGAVDELNGKLPRGVSLEKSLDTPLYGKSSKLDSSLDFVSFIMEVEDKVREEFGVEVVINVDENLLSKGDSPFLTLGTLIEYLAGILNEAELKGE